MKLSMLVISAGLALASPATAFAQESGTCEPQTIAQLLGLEAMSGCLVEPVDPGEGGGTETPDEGDRVTGLLNAHQASGGRSTAALEHANTMSGGAVLAAHSRDGEHSEDASDEDGGNARGRPAHARRP